MAVPHDVRQPKVGDFNVHLGVQQQVFGLQIPVHHLHTREGQFAFLMPRIDNAKYIPLSVAPDQPQHWEAPL